MFDGYVNDCEVNYISRKLSKTKHYKLSVQIAFLRLKQLPNYNLTLKNNGNHSFHHCQLFSVSITFYSISIIDSTNSW